jgi:hypothetical protein
LATNPGLLVLGKTRAGRLNELVDLVSKTSSCHFVGQFRHLRPVVGLALLVVVGFRPGCSWFLPFGATALVVVVIVIIIVSLFFSTTKRAARIVRDGGGDARCRGCHWRHRRKRPRMDELVQSLLTLCRHRGSYRGERRAPGGVISDAATLPSNRRKGRRWSRRQCHNRAFITVVIFVVLDGSRRIRSVVIRHDDDGLLLLSKKGKKKKYNSREKNKLNGVNGGCGRRSLH